ncbi:MAG: DNA polymerase III subunit delta [Hyphomicrobiales bacterium]|nr:DNA polymerase III subunit delta [Hyphomicrobiales bacterium]MBV9516886.1 DNA polymerase III subunit delta [Hyphomicrobiales bacterium]
MVAIKPAEAESFLRRLPKTLELILLHGPDAGLIDERCRAVLASAVADPGDPFQLVRLAGDQLAANPERLIEEASAIGLFGPRKAIWVQAFDKPIDRSVKLLLDGPAFENLVVIQAGDLSKQSALRTLCERSQRAAALACYAGGERENAALVDEMLTESGLMIEPGAKRDLLGALGPDRRQSRSEIEKLVLYKLGEKKVTSEDVAIVMVDANAVAMNAVIDAAFAGDYAGLDRELSRAFAERLGSDPILGAAIRHVFSIAEARAKVEAGMSASEAAKEMRLFWKREGAVTRQLAIWSSAALDGALADLQAAVRRIRRSSLAAESVARMAFWRIARHARSSAQR